MGGPEASTAVAPGQKRQRANLPKDKESRKRKRQYYGGGVNTNTISRTIPHGSRGFLISCEPKKEVQCYREAYVLLAEQIEALVPALAERLGGDAGAKPAGKPAGADAAAAATAGGGSAVVAEPAADVADAVAAEVAALRNRGNPAGRAGDATAGGAVMSRADLGCNGSVFVRVAEDAVPVEKVVSGLLRAARENGTPGCRACVRFVPVHSTCYAKPEEAAAATGAVVEKHFPEGKGTFAIRFRSRLNSNAHRDDYIKAVAGAVDEAAPARFKVDLDKPDVTLCIEIVRTQCVLGVVPDFGELAKLNIREISTPTDAVPSSKEQKPNTAEEPAEIDSKAINNGKDANLEGAPKEEKVPRTTGADEKDTKDAPEPVLENGGTEIGGIGPPSNSEGGTPAAPEKNDAREAAK